MAQAAITAANAVFCERSFMVVSLPPRPMSVRPARVCRTHGWPERLLLLRYPESSGVIAAVCKHRADTPRRHRHPAYTDARGVVEGVGDCRGDPLAAGLSHCGGR